ncbi:F0F1 ATP synthase subunit A [Paenibacillus bovis]|uniref:ATP synthase subunit a n=1 Tax=Paenibacillus bovis TaxID=1616788 RepID=A0A172ZLU6_9BACL|nr:F0F1 ATP synthase subunit A [Paenibacillus bovis]ANF98523.1 F0F1 ATP synthase subunit A [Paenibacillus bovis]
MHESPIINVGFDIDLSVVIMLIVTCAIVFILAKMSIRNLSVENPSKLQNFMEWVVDFVQGLITSTMDYKKGRPFLSLGITLIMFIFVGNMLGLPFGLVFDYTNAASATFFGHPLTPVVEGLANGSHGVEIAWWKSPTADAAAAMGLALIVFVLVHYLGIVRNPKHYFAHYFKPFFFFFPINVIEQLSKLLTHGMRLFGNIFAGEVLIAVLLKMSAVWYGAIASVIGLVVWQGFSIFVGTIQAFVFTILAMVYISQSLETDEDH